MSDSIKNRASVSTSPGHRDGVSPTPWRVIKAFEDEPARIIDADDEEVAVELIDADAALIVEAVNERDRLRDLVRRLADALDTFPAIEDHEIDLLREAREAVGESMKEAGDKSRESAVEGRRAVKTKPKVLPYVYLDIDAEADGKEFRNREVRVGANCSVFDSTWPTKCPFYRGYMDPPQDGEECVYGRSGECACREVRVEAMRRFKEFVDEFLAEVEGVE